MTYIGSQGGLELQRQFPDPRVLPASALSGSTVVINSVDWWPADPVTLVHRTTGGGTASIAGFLHRDVLDRCSLHSTATGALNNDDASRLSLSAVAAGPMVVTMTGSAGQTTALQSFLAALTPAPATERGLRAYPADLAAYRAAGPLLSPWRFQGELRNWRLELNAREADTSAIGERFGSSVKAAVTGGGTCDFLIHLYAADDWDSGSLMRLLLMLDHGSAGRARFYLKPQTEEAICAGIARRDLASSLFYRSDILIVKQSVEVKADDIVEGSANFATTGPVRLASDVI
jgi:hypothetical protein